VGTPLRSEPGTLRVGPGATGGTDVASRERRHTFVALSWILRSPTILNKGRMTRLIGGQPARVLGLLG
jgi:hypothetical protein